MTIVTHKVGQGARALLLAGIVLILLIRAAFPAGWMPATAGGFAITLCTGIGVETVWIDDAGEMHREPKGKGSPSADTPCAFSVLGVSTLPIVAAAIAAASVDGPVASPFRRSEITLGHGLVAPPPPSTGPPTTL